MNELPKINAALYREFRAERNRQLEGYGSRLKAIKEVVALNDRLEATVDQLEMFFHSSGGTGEQTCFRLAAPSRAGKTTAIGLFRHLHPSIGAGKKKLDHSAMDECSDPRSKISQPVLYVEIPVKQAIPQLAEAILTALKDPAPTQGKPMEKVARIDLYVREQGVQVIILDELQHLISRENDKVNHDSADWIKERMNGLPCGFVLSGTERVLRIFKVNEQLTGRAEGDGWQMKPWDMDNKADFSSAEEYYAQWDQKLIDVAGFEVSGLSDAALVSRLLVASQGWPGAGAKLIHNAARAAIYRGARALHRAEFAEAFDQLLFLRGSEGLNPFKTDAVPLMQEVWRGRDTISDLFENEKRS